MSDLNVINEHQLVSNIALQPSFLDRMSREEKWGPSRVAKPHHLVHRPLFPVPSARALLLLWRLPHGSGAIGSWEKGVALTALPWEKNGRKKYEANRKEQGWGALLGWGCLNVSRIRWVGGTMGTVSAVPQEILVRPEARAGAFRHSPPVCARQRPNMGELSRRCAGPAGPPEAAFGGSLRCPRWATSWPSTSATVAGTNMRPWMTT